MSTKYKIAPEIRIQIINRIKIDGIPVSQAAKEHGISTKTIYSWLGKSADSPTYGEIQRLKKQNKTLMELIGSMTLKLSETKKKS